MSRATSPLQRAERLEWVDGSALTWRDLRDGVATEEAMLALHMRSLHDTWGVALGLNALLAADRLHVLVTPGFAITCLGMSILLPGSASMSAPASPGAWDLVLHAPLPTPGDPCARLTTCDNDMPIRAATVKWHAASARLEQQSSVVLARFVLQPNGLLDGPDLQGRRGVRVLERPHISGGVVAAGGITWTTSDNRLVGHIDTSAAGFSRAPVYRVWVASHEHWPNNVISALLSVVSAAREQVNVQLLVPGGASMNTAGNVGDGLSIGWLGVEPVRGCPPSFSAVQVASAIGRLDLSLWTAALEAVPGFQP